MAGVLLTGVQTLEALGLQVYRQRDKSSGTERERQCLLGGGGGGGGGARGGGGGARGGGSRRETPSCRREGRAASNCSLQQERGQITDYRRTTIHHHHHHHHHTWDFIALFLMLKGFRTHNADSGQGSGLIMLTHVRVQDS
ncbi:hypothetical protein F7725_006320 [Dissostichus mawsoni]|uniref:Uncharacterized protein n=1 Tax=Dissostichus mawsoni TaxID=36200 RepID=A0A7J5XWG4_DISMA|nr:hypothetical protein F7725_006320 [Dissostichus mawsoni]